MKSHLLLLALGIAAIHPLNAQKSRVYLGHKNVIEANYTAYIPMFASEAYYTYRNGQLSQQVYGGKFPQGFQVALSRHLTKSTGFGLEFDYTSCAYASDATYYGTYNGLYQYGQYYNVEKIDVHYMSFIGKFEFGRKDGIFPIGLSHQVGGGYTVISANKSEGELHAQPISSYSNGYSPSDTLVKYKLGNSYGMTVFYNLNFRIALSRRMLLNIGARYNFNYVFKDENSSKAQMEFRSGMNDKLVLNFMRFYTGLAFSF